MKIKRFENDEFVTYSFDSLEKLNEMIEKWKKEFRENNKTDEVIKSGISDRSYERYCQQLDELSLSYKD